jgi:hypothetical protein
VAGVLQFHDPAKVTAGLGDGATARSEEGQGGVGRRGNGELRWTPRQSLVMGQRRDLTEAETVWRQATARFGGGRGHVRRRGNGELWRRPRQGQAAGQRSASPSFLCEREGPRRPLATGEKQLRAIHVFRKRWTRGSVVLEGSVDPAF